MDGAAPQESARGAIQAPDPGQLSYRVHDVARALGISDRTVWRMIKAGKIASFHVGRSVRIPVSEIHRIMQRGADIPKRAAATADVLRMARDLMARGSR